MRALAISFFLPFPLLGDGSGAFQSPLRIGGVFSPVAVTAGDFNHDGRLDLAATAGSGKIGVVIQHSENRQLWTPAPSADAGNGSFHLRAADFDGDGTADLAVSDP